jgi:hypothetical protein
MTQKFVEILQNIFLFQSLLNDVVPTLKALTVTDAWIHCPCPIAGTASVAPVAVLSSTDLHPLVQGVSPKRAVRIDQSEGGKSFLKY